MHIFSKPLNDHSWFKKNKMMSTSLFALVMISLYEMKKYYADPKKEKKQDVIFPVMNTDQQQKLGVNKQFLQQLESIVTILFPTWHTKEVLLLILHSIFLILRTYLSVVVARLDGRIVKDLVRNKKKKKKI